MSHRYAVFAVEVSESGAETLAAFTGSTQQRLWIGCDPARRRRVLRAYVLSHFSTEYVENARQNPITWRDNP